VSGARVLIVTQDDHDQLYRDAEAAGLDHESLVILRASHERMPDLVRLMDLGVFFIQPSFSARAAVPTKLAEFLATGVPVVVSDRIGDASELIRSSRTGLVLEQLDAAALAGSIPQVIELLGDSDVRRRCREVAERHFDVDAGVAAYSALYRALRPA
jgi:glycosyltransferase involved in cell wall biosynthesis